MERAQQARLGCRHHHRGECLQAGGSPEVMDARHRLRAVLEEQERVEEALRGACCRLLALLPPTMVGAGPRHVGPQENNVDTRRKGKPQEDGAVQTTGVLEAALAEVASLEEEERRAAAAFHVALQAYAHAHHAALHSAHHHRRLLLTDPALQLPPPPQGGFSHTATPLMPALPPESVTGTTPSSSSPNGLPLAPLSPSSAATSAATSPRPYVPEQWPRRYCVSPSCFFLAARPGCRSG